jgi:uncharacterized protein YabE (DUF348 family)
MRPILYVVAGLVALVLLVVLLLGGGVAWFTHKVTTTKVDVNNEQTADAFRSNFESNCTARASRGIDASDYQKIALVKQVCGCDAKALIAYMRRNKDMTVLELETKLLSRDEQIMREFDSCNKAYGVEVSPG